MLVVLQRSKEEVAWQAAEIIAGSIHRKLSLRLGLATAERWLGFIANW